MPYFLPLLLVVTLAAYVFAFLKAREAARGTAELRARFDEARRALETLTAALKDLDAPAVKAALADLGRRSDLAAASAEGALAASREARDESARLRAASEAATAELRAVCETAGVEAAAAAAAARKAADGASDAATRAERSSRAAAAAAGGDAASERRLRMFP